MTNVEPVKNWRSELRRIWAVHVPTADGAITSHELARRLGDPFRLATDSSGSRHLLIPSTVTSGPRQFVGDSLKVSGSRWVFDRTTMDFLDISCPRADLFGVFDELIVSILDEALAASDPVGVTDEVLARWRRLLATRAPLSERRAMALFAEMHVLDVATIGRSFDPEHWRGPLNEPKDIVGPGGWIEVKAAGVRSESVTVHGLEQLDDIAGLHGTLAVVVVERNEAGTKLKELADRLRARSVDPERFDERLATTGYSTAAADAGWTVVEVIASEAKLCPRIVPSDLRAALPAGIQRLSYDVSLSVVRSHSHKDGVAALTSAMEDT